MYQIPKLLNIKHLFHAFSTVKEGNMANAILGKTIEAEKVKINRKIFLDKIGVPINKTICMYVQGGCEVDIAKPKDSGISVNNVNKAVKTDGLITNKKGLYLMLLIADCLPIIIYDPELEVVGVVHAGWKGVDLNIAEKAVNMFMAKYNSKPASLIVAFGPAARKESFIKENPSQLQNPIWKNYLNPTKNGYYQVDFIGLCKKQFIASGIKRNNIIDCKLDTIKDFRFFSHFRDKDKTIFGQGRFACIVGIK